MEQKLNQHKNSPSKNPQLIHLSSFKDLSRQSSSSQELKECRICFLNTNQEDILMNPCKCKGSMSCVHQECLIKWLTQNGKRQCELCKSNFKFVEEWGSIREIIRNNVKYVFGDRRRLIVLGIYSLYIYLFTKRFILVLKYFKHLVQKYIINRFFKQAGKEAINLDVGKLKPKEKVLMVIGRLIKMIKFLYSLFIVFQLSALAMIESKRIKDFFKIMINNSKSLRIQGGRQ